MNVIYFIVQQTMYFSIPLLVVALGGMFSERSGVVNIALEGMMIMGAFAGILFINIFQDVLSGQLLLIIAIIIAGSIGVIFSLFHAYASINMKAVQVISGYSIEYVCACLCDICCKDDPRGSTNRILQSI